MTSLVGESSTCAAVARQRDQTTPSPLVHHLISYTHPDDARDVLLAFQHSGGHVAGSSHLEENDPRATSLQAAPDFLFSPLLRAPSPSSSETVYDCS